MQVTNVPASSSANSVVEKSTHTPGQRPDTIGNQQSEPLPPDDNSTNPDRKSVFQQAADASKTGNLIPSQPSQDPEAKVQTNVAKDFPAEVRELIASHLGADDLDNLKLANKEWYHTLQSLPFKKMNVDRLVAQGDHINAKKAMISMRKLDPISPWTKQAEAKYEPLKIEVEKRAETEAWKCDREIFNLTVKGVFNCLGERPPKNAAVVSGARSTLGPGEATAVVEKFKAKYPDSHHGDKLAKELNGRLVQKTAQISDMPSILRKFGSVSKDQTYQIDNRTYLNIRLKDQISSGIFPLVAEGTTSDVCQKMLTKIQTLFEKENVKLSEDAWARMEHDIYYAIKVHIEGSKSGLSDTEKYPTSDTSSAVGESDTEKYPTFGISSAGGESYTEKYPTFGISSTGGESYTEKYRIFDTNDTRRGHASDESVPMSYDWDTRTKIPDGKERN